MTTQPAPDITPFTHPAFGQLRTHEEDGRVLFCGRDAATALGYSNTKDALARHCKGVAKHYPLATPGGEQQFRFISEGDLYRLIAHSKLPAAVQFEAWVFDEVLPAIRQRGGYLTPEAAEKALTDPDFIIRLATDLKRARAEREAMAAYARELEPKAANYDRFLSGDGTYSIGAVAKILGRSQNKLFDELRNAGILIAKGAMRNTPYQKYMHHFTVRAHDYTRSDGTVGTSYTTKVQPSGLAFIQAKLGIGQGALI